jgi:SAM-dependent methyltransferase
MDQYRVGEFEAPRAEVSRLQGQAQLISVQERAALAAVGVPTSGRGIEIGCGPGFFAEGLRRDDLGRKIVGLDVDAYVLREARRRLPVVRGDGRTQALPFRPASFDFAYSRLFLRHVEDPAAALAGMKTLVKPGGCLAAIDGSDASLLLDPIPTDFAAVAAARREWFTRRACSADIGHRLPGLFARAELREVKVKAVVLDSATVGREAFAHVVLTPFLQAAQPVLNDPPRLAAATAAVERWIRSTESYGAITLFVVGGRL